MEIVKNVAVMMPFGGDSVERRRCILNYLRLKYLIEQRVNVAGNEGQHQIRYSLRFYHLAVGRVKGPILKALAEADILLGIITETNANVIYELAIRNLLRDELVLIVKGDNPKAVPLYLQDWAKIQLDHHESGRINQQIESIAKAPEPHLSFESKIVPESLIKLIDQEDENLRAELEAALQMIENREIRRSDDLIRLVGYLDPGDILHRWKTYYPYSVLRMRWKKKSNNFKYGAEDREGMPLVYAANSEFFRMYNLVYDQAPDPDGPEAIDAALLLKQLYEAEEEVSNNGHFLMERKDWEEFLSDQDRLNESIVFGDGFDWASVPIRFNGGHPFKRYQHSAYLPIMIGKHFIGEQNKPHTSYYLIVYVRIDKCDHRTTTSTVSTEGEYRQESTAILN